MQAERGDFDGGALGRGRVEEAREPGERDAEFAAVGEVDPHGRLVEADVSGRNGDAWVASHNFAVR